MILRQKQNQRDTHGESFRKMERMHVLGFEMNIFLYQGDNHIAELRLSKAMREDAHNEYSKERILSTNQGSTRIISKEESQTVRKVLNVETSSLISCTFV